MLIPPGTILRETPPPTWRILSWLPHEKSAFVNALYLLPVFLARGDWRRCGLAEQAENDSRRERLSEWDKVRFFVWQCDYAAMRAAFTSEWSNGSVESQVNC
ncbi:MAG TPA: hypothetical protein VKU38_08845 [Ktedonobacteraceae bacterium]|nr:hypothetical protein [Ktedonobacteraceae bacterium]